MECASIVTFWSALPFLYLNYCLHLQLGEAVFFACSYFSTVFIISMAVCLVLKMVSFIARGSKWSLLAEVVTFVFLLGMLVYLTTDACVYALYRTHLDESMLKMGLDGNVVQLDWTVKFKAALIIALYAAALFVSLRLAVMRRLWVCLAVIFFVLSVGFNVSYSYCWSAGNPVFENAIEMTPMCRPLKMSKFWRKMGVVKSEGQIDFVDLASGESGLRYPLKPMACGKGGMNILIIAVDALRSDVVTKDVMPNVSEVADESLVFMNHYSGGNHTKQGIFSLFYSLPGTYWSSVWKSRVPPVMLDVMKNGGYEMKVFASAPLNEPDFKNSVFSNVPSLRSGSEGDTPVSRDVSALHDFEDWLSHKGEDGRPFFSFVFFDAVHGQSLLESDERPFKPALEKVDHLDLGPDFAPAPYFNLYKNAVWNTDRRIGRIIQDLKDKGLYDSTLVVITSDHGEEFNDNQLNYWGHGGNFTASQIHIPLIVHWPGRGHVVYDHRTASHDLVPTLLKQVFHCENEPREFCVGRNLFDDSSREFVYSFGYSQQSYVERNRIVMRLQSGRLVYKDPTFHDSEDKSFPSYFARVLEENRRFSN